MLAVAGGSMALYTASEPAELAPTSITIDDEAGILDVAAVEASVEDVDFYEPTDVAVLTVAGDADDDNENALNDAALAHARETRPEWLGADGQTWADDLYLFAVDPEGRLVGTYFGENREVGEGSQEDIQEATKDDLRAGEWSEGAIAGVEEAAGRMNAPFMRTAGGIVLPVMAGLAALAGFGTWWGVGANRSRKSRALLDEARERRASIDAEAAATERYAFGIPEESRYGFQVLRRLDDYRRGVRELDQLGAEAEAVPPAKHNRRDVLTQLTAYRDKARELDHLDDAIADTAILLNRETSWPDAWERQVSPLREDLEKVEPLLTEEAQDEVRELPEAYALREFAATALARLDEIGDRLGSAQLSPDDALDGLRATRDELTEHLETLADRVVETVGSSDDERQTLRAAMSKERAGYRAAPSIIGTAYPAWGFYPVVAFGSGMSNGTTEITQASSGGSASYSSGGFSGAGSSSSF